MIAKKKSTDENKDNDDETLDEENGEDFMTQLSESFMSSFSYPVTMISSMFDDDDENQEDTNESEETEEHEEDEEPEKKRRGKNKQSKTKKNLKKNNK